MVEVQRQAATIILWSMIDRPELSSAPTDKCSVVQGFDVESRGLFEVWSLELLARYCKNHRLFLIWLWYNARGCSFLFASILLLLDAPLVLSQDTSGGQNGIGGYWFQGIATSSLSPFLACRQEYLGCLSYVAIIPTIVIDLIEL